MEKHAIVHFYNLCSPTTNSLHTPSTTVISEGLKSLCRDIDVIYWSGVAISLFIECLKTASTMQRSSDVDQCASDQAQTIRIDSIPTTSQLQWVCQGLPLAYTTQMNGAFKSSTPLDDSSNYPLPQPQKHPQNQKAIS